MAIGAMLAIKKKGLDMLNDIGLVGFNEEPILSLVSPTIYSIEQPSFELGNITAKLFIDTMHNNCDMNDIEKVLKPKLFVRESSQRIIIKK